MLRKINELRTQKGSLMIEALAMLGLISMVTPVIYKKAAERTTEMQDINAASQVRIMVKALDDYLRDNYATITAGGKVSSSSATADKEIEYTGFGGEEDETKSQTVNIEHFRDYLPLGFKADGKIFKDFDVAIKQTFETNSKRKALTAILVAKTSSDGSVDDTFTKIRSARIASMIGTNGGYIDGDKATGVQGVWEISKDQLPGTADSGTIVATSVEAVADGTSGGSDVLHRVHVDGHPEYNVMATTLDMGNFDIVGLKDLISHGDTINMKKQGATHGLTLDVDGKGLYRTALYAGANAIEAAPFKADSAFMQHTKALFVGTERDTDAASANPAQFYVDGNDGSMKALKGKFQVANFGSVPFMQLTGDNNVTVVNANENLVSFMDQKFRVDPNANTAIDGTLAANKSAGGNSQNNWKPYNLNVENTETTLESAFRSGKKSSYSGPANWNDYNFNLYGGTASLESGIDIAKLAVPVGSYNYGVNIDNTTGNTDLTGVLQAGYNAAEAYPGFNTKADKDYLYAGSTNTAYQTDYAWKPYNMQVGHNTASFESGLNVGRKTTTATPAGYTPKDYNLNVTSNAMTTEGTLSALKVMDGSPYYFMNTYRDVSAEGSMFGVGMDESRYNSGYVDAYNMVVYSNRIHMGKGWDKAAGEGAFVQVVNNNTSPDIRMGVKNRYRNDFVIGASEGNDGYQVMVNTPNFLVTDAGDNLFQVDTERRVATEDRTGVYIRKGVMEVYNNDNRVPILKLATLEDRSNYDGKYPSDRIEQNKYIDPNGLYRDYQINPAYTSVMHDIKLSTRGGARLSDILPDFINKGIYVMDNTYKVVSGDGDWTTASVSDNFVLAGLGTCTNTHCDTSPWMGFIPTPNCPPGYMKVATIAPIRFNMAQTGVPMEVDSTDIEGINAVTAEYRALGARHDPRGDNVTINNKRTGNTAVLLPMDNNNNLELSKEGITWTDKDNNITSKAGHVATILNAPYTFQVSTWLNTTIKAYKPDAKFKGWHGIMGFIYPAKDYKAYAKAIKPNLAEPNDNEIYWNLFPVYKEELSAIATVYCYFNRTDESHSNMFVDQYLAHKAGSIANIRNMEKKGSTYDKELNDPDLRYNNYW